ncbi:MAG: hypothetical protein V4560_07695 [Bacteroidota bacterium]
MKRKSFTVIGLIMLSIVMSLNVRAQSSPNDKTIVKAFVQKFYDWYVPLYNAEKVSYVGAINKEPAYFDFKLIHVIIRDYKEQPDGAGEILGLDFDPFLGAQDTGWDYQAGNVNQTGKKFLVDIHGASTGKSKKEILAAKVHLIAEVQKTEGQWKFTNFIYPDTKYPIDLLTLLTNLRKDRNEWLVKHHQKPHTN